MKRTNTVSFAVSNATKVDIRSLQLVDLEEAARKFGQPQYRARQIADWLYQKRVQSFDEMTDLPREFRARLAGEFEFEQDRHRTSAGFARYDPQISVSPNRRKFDRIRVDSGLAGALRIAFGSPDTLRFDSGWLCVRLQILRERPGRIFPKSAAERNRRSNHRGGTRNAVRRSTTSSSWEWANRWRISTTCMRAIRIINAPWGLGIGARHITVSTSGLAPQIRKLADEPLQIRLAISLHGATDEVRNQIMPINRRYNLETLAGGL